MHRPACQIFGLVGLGKIGRIVAGYSRSLGYQVMGCDPRAAGETIGITVSSPEEVVRRSDILSLHVPLLPQTEKLIDRAAITSMKTGAILMNGSRGGLVDEPTLAEALASGHLAGAGLDVFATDPLEKTNALRNVPNLLTPHRFLRRCSMIARHGRSIAAVFPTAIDLP